MMYSRRPTSRMTKKYKRIGKQMRRHNIAAMNTRTGGLIGLELKYVDYEHPNVPILTTVGGSTQDPLTALALNAIGQGTGESQRLGLRAVIKSLDIRGYVDWDATSFSVGSFVRIVVYMDKQTNSSTSSTETLLLDDPAGTGQDTLAHRLISNLARFTVLSDTIVKQPPVSPYWNGSAAALSPTSTPFRIRKSFGKNGFVTRFTTTGATIAAIADNSIKILAIGEHAGNSMHYVSRVRFLAD